MISKYDGQNRGHFENTEHFEKNLEVLRENWIRNSYKNWVILGIAKEFDGGFENLARYSDVKFQGVESFSDIWEKRNAHMLTKDKPAHWNALKMRAQNRKVIKSYKRKWYRFLLQNL